MSMSILEAEIRDRAYAIWEEEGRPQGRERQHWEQAARDVLASGRSESVAGKPGEMTAGETRTGKAKSAGAKGRVRKAA